MLSVHSNTKQLTAHLNRIQRKQIPFATAKALTQTAFDVKRTLQNALPRRLDRPTKGIINSVQVDKATKYNVTARVGFAGLGFGKTAWKESPAKIMRRHIKGGTRYPNKRAIAVPVKQRTNKYGNLPRNKISKLLGEKAKYFSGTPKGMSNAGIYQRQKKKLKMLVAWEPKANYKGGRFPFKSIVKIGVSYNYRKRFVKALQDALKTAR